MKIHQPYDLIGDIHGHADALESLLLQLNYQPDGPGYRHPKGRNVIFLGDYIDRGPKIRRTLEIVRAMVDSGQALALMGNHEFNALTFHTPDGKGGWLRPHTEEKLHQHAATLEQLAAPHPTEWRQWMDWFRTLPLFLELPGLRAVHAAWDADAIELIRHLGPLNEELLRQIAPKNTPLGRARNLLLCGRELRLPKGHFFTDKSGFQRHDIRLRWWENPYGKTYRQMVFPDSDTVPELPIPEKRMADLSEYPTGAPPVFMGHYWLPANAPCQPVARNIACLDYSVAKGGRLTAYRWDGEGSLDTGKFVSVTHEANGRANLKA